MEFKTSKYDFEEGNVMGEPVSPSSQSLSTSVMTLGINIILEFEQPIPDIDCTLTRLADALLPKNPLFSCILEENEKGAMMWKKTKVKVDDHIFIPKFPLGLECYDSLVNDYVCNLHLRPFNYSIPLWEFHLLTYKTSQAEATWIIRVHHAVGDGISLMSTLFSFVTRADNPTLSPTFPQPRKLNVLMEKKLQGTQNWFILKHFQMLWCMVLVLWYTMLDVIHCLLRVMGWMEDSKLPMRGPPGVEFLPISVSHIDFSLRDLKQIRNRIGGTVNDVISGIIFCGVQRYVQISLLAGGEQSLEDAYEKRSIPKHSITMKNKRATALTMINMRTLAGLENLEEMMKPNTQIRWGNHYGMLRVPIPLKNMKNPLDFVKMTKCIFDRQKMSLGVFAIAKIMGYIGRFRGAKALAKCAYKTSTSSTMMISNMIGPKEKIAIDGNVVKRFSFYVSGGPTALAVFVLSYMDTITIQVLAQKDYINIDIILNLFREAFEEIKEASIHDL
ncbi:hypothetical protein SUGI_0635620 [Cryptomeria japonica]|nr:hypothetical protein SUGI_0635620 [Cryptomeria japonica]